MMMIDLLNTNGTNGGEDTKIPCPFCRRLAEISAMVEEFSSYPLGDNPLPAIDLMASEIRMWRAKETYDRKLKNNLVEGINSKIKEQEL